MWLLNAKTLDLESFYGDAVPPYAILSHRWRDPEVLYQDMTERKHNPEVLARAAYSKIRKTCDLALNDGLKYVWVDTCCIDKRSSAELSEAINSMFQWYWRAAKCYAYLDDVEYPSPPLGRQRRDTQFRSLLEESGFRDSSWFTRGWTLQELLAPCDVTFYDKDWKFIGTRQQDLSVAINEITNIDKIVLEERDVISLMSVAKRMSWAAERSTTRIEDKAYSLLGIFGVNMPMLYGEEDRAFLRLQQEIIRTSTDQSILTWSARPNRALANGEPEPDSAGILAASPSEFAACRNILFPDDNPVHQSYDLTNAGLRMKLPVVADNKVSWGILNCQQDGFWLGIQLEPVAASRIHNTKKLLEKDLNGYAILPIREGSHTKYMTPKQTKDAALEDIIIIPRSKLQRTTTGSLSPISLRFVNCHTSKPKTHYKIVEMMPPGLWDQSNAIQPANHKDHFAIPFRPVTETALGSITLEDASSKHRLAVIFSYDADQRATRSKAPYLELGERCPEDWDELSSMLPKIITPYETEESKEKPIEASIEVRGIKMIASLHSQTNANGDRELELRFKEASGIQQMLKNAIESDEVKQVKAWSMSTWDRVQSSERFKKVKGGDAASVRSGSTVKSGGTVAADDGASILSSASKVSIGSKATRNSKDARADSGFSGT